MSLHFGIFDSFDLDYGAVGELLENRLRFAQEVERLGMSHYHATEHHGTPLSVCPSPNLFLAALSQRTASMRIGTLVNVLPAYDPLRLAEEIAVLDQLSGGRVDFGVGSGVSPIELEYVGVAGDQAKAIYQESLQVVTSALRTGRMTHRGELLRSYDVELSVQPVQSPYPELWYASSRNPVSAEWAGANAVNFVARWEGGEMTKVADIYWAAFDAHRNDSDRLNPQVTSPRVGISGPVVIADSQGEADDIFGRANDLHEQRILHLWHQRDDHRLDGFFSGERVLSVGDATVGTVASVRDQMVAQVAQADINYVEMKIMFGDVTPAQGIHTARCVMEQVAPAAREAAVRRSRLARA